MAALATALAALSLGPVFVESSWVGPTVATVLAAAVGGAAGRRLGLPRPLVPGLGLIAVVGVLTLLYARDVAVWWVLPGPAAWGRFGDLTTEGLDVVSNYAAPVPALPGAVLLAAAGVGAVALAVDTIAVTYRNAALAGLALFGLYAVPVAVVRDGVPWLDFLAAALGWLALMLTEGNERLSGWGRALGRRHTALDAQERVPTTAPLPSEPLGMAGRRIGAAALGVAVLVPWLVPGLSEPVIGRGGGGLGAGSGKTVLTVNPFVSLQAELDPRNDAEVLRYQTTDPQPDYLRMVTLDTFDGVWWKPAVLRSAGRADGDQPAAPGLGGGISSQRVKTTVDIGGLSQTWLPLPYPVESIDGLGGQWVYDEATRNVFALKGDSHGRSYTVQSLRLQPTVAQLQSAGPAPADLARKYTQLPDNLPPMVRQLAEQVTRDARTDYDKAVALQRYFLTDGFEYTTSPPGFDGSPLVAFLTSKKGFCQQFAGTFGVMARLVGLPTRLNVGFTHGVKDGDVWRVSRTNAHAWPEVYFQGVGWVRFEPTPGPTGVTAPTWAPAAALPGQDQGTTPDSQSTPQSASADPRRAPLDQTTADASSAPLSGVARRLPFTLIATAALVLVLAALPGLRARSRRRSRLRQAAGPDPGLGVRAAWAELADHSADLGEPWPDAETPRQAAGRLCGSLPEPVHPAVRRLALAVERVRYADRPGMPQHVLDDTRKVLDALDAQAGRRRRAVARFAPATVLSAAVGGLSALVDGVDSGWMRLRGGVRRAGRRVVAGRA